MTGCVGDARSLRCVFARLTYEPERELPATYEIDPQRRLVTSRLWGGVTDDEVYAHNEKLRTDPRFDPTYRQLTDLTGVTEIAVSTSMINETSLDQFFEPGTRRAIIATDDGVFGMARMYALRAEGLGQRIEVFREEQPAREWLGI
jgi:hypothetical protein